jgi:acyl-CoA thioesterase-1
MHKILLFLFCFSAPALANSQLVIIGDSLTEGYGIAKEQAYPALLEKKLQAAGKKWKVQNSGVSGSTSASAPKRIQWALKGKPQAILLALGANDGLRGLSTTQLEENLKKSVEMVKKENVKIFLAGIYMPPNYGKEYAQKFANVFPKVAKDTDIPLLPFLLDSVAANPELNLADGIHPNEEGHKIMAETVFQFLKDKL